MRILSFLRSLLAGWFVFGLLSLAHAAPAAETGPRALHVLEISTDDADDQAKALTLALKNRLRTSKNVTLVDSEYSLQVVSLALKCGEVPNATCQAKIASKIKAERYIWGVMKRAPGAQVQVEMHLWQQGQADVVDRISFSNNLTDSHDPAMTRIAEQLSQRLLRVDEVGTLRISWNNPAEGDLYIDERRYEKFVPPTMEIVVPAGNHSVELRAAGRTLARGRVTCVPKETRQLTLLAPPAPIEKATVVPASREEVSEPNWRRTVATIGWAVGASALAGGVVASLQVSNDNNSFQDNRPYAAYRSGILASEDACALAKQGQPSLVAGAASPADVAKLCDHAATFNVLQYVFYGVGALAIGAGTYVFFSPSSKQESPAPAPVARPTRWHLSPNVRAGSAAMDFRLSF